MSDLSPRPVDPEGLAESDHPLWKLDRVELRSIGIDIGSATTHLVFSALEMRRQSSALSSRFMVTDRRILSQSAVTLTPFRDGLLLDTEKLRQVFEAAYEEAGIAPEDLATGAVITTGNAARKQNADAVAHMFAGLAGRFVCATAGAAMEARLAAHGSGAVARSLAEDRPVVLNVDVGGGTTKLALVRAGIILAVTAIDVGARLLLLAPDGTVTHIEPAARLVAEQLGHPLNLGETLPAGMLRRIVAAMLGCVMEAAAGGPISPLTERLTILPGFADALPFGVVLASGGVAEYVYSSEAATFGDLGPLLAAELRKQLASRFPQASLEPSRHRIRATVIGASQFTAQVSGNTIYVPDRSMLPVRNVKVAKFAAPGEGLDRTGIAAAAAAAIRGAELEADTPIALALEWPHGPAFRRLQALCGGVADAVRSCGRAETPLVLIIDIDLAQTVGADLAAELGEGAKVVCIDGVTLEEFDYVDIGEEDPIAHVVTVTAKSLLFQG